MHKTLTIRGFKVLILVLGLVIDARLRSQVHRATVSAGCMVLPLAGAGLAAEVQVAGSFLLGSRP